jgi:flagellar M-ring protein FliF
MAAVDVDALKRRATHAARAFTPAQLTVAGLMLVVALVGGFAFLKWVLAPSYTVLLSGLSAKDASAVTAKLDADGVAYKLSNGGTTVLVPEAALDKERIAVAAAGLPASATSSGWSAFDKQGMTSSSFQQQVAYQRAIEGTLSDSIKQLDGVSSAEVHLALPKDKLFSDQQQATTASVLVTTDKDLSDETVDAITHLVASSVSGLDPKNVSITDSSGHLLTGEGATNSDKAVKARQAYETQMDARLQTMLDTVLGAGRSVVRVSAEMDNSDTTKDSETYNPDQTVALSSATSEEKYGNGTGSTTGQTTTGTVELPDAVNPIDDGTTTGSTNGTSTTGNGYSKTTNTATNGVSRTVEHSVVSAGGIKRLTVAVAVDANTPSAPAAADLEKVVSNALGLDPARGDTINVSQMAFPGSTKETPSPSAAGTAAAGAGAEAAVKAGPVEMIKAHATEGLGGFLLVLIAFGLLRGLKRGTKTDVSSSELESAMASALPSGGSPRALPGGAAAQGQLDDRMKNTDDVAGLLRGWLADSNGGR